MRFLYLLRVQSRRRCARGSTRRVEGPVQVVCSAGASPSMLSAHPVLQVTHLNLFCSTAIDLGALKLATPIVVPDELSQVRIVLSNRCRARLDKCEYTLSPLSRVHRDERIRKQSANMLDISAFNASACSSHGSGSTNSPHPHEQRTRKPSALNARTRRTRHAKRKLLSAVWLAQG